MPSCSVLLLGADLKHVLRTVAASVDFKGCFRFVLADPNPHIQARNLVLLRLLLDNENGSRSEEDNASGGHNKGSAVAFIRALYSLHLDQETYHAIKNAMMEILEGHLPRKKADKRFSDFYPLIHNREFRESQSKYSSSFLVLLPPAKDFCGRE